MAQKILTVIALKKFDSRFVRCLEALSSQTYPLENFYICSESPSGNTEDDVMHAYNMARKYLLKNRQFDLMLTVEADIIAPKDSVELLVGEMGNGWDLVSGLFRMRPNGNLAAFIERPDVGNFPENLGSVCNNKKAYEALKKKEVIKVDTGCFGMTLMKRRVLEVIGWRRDKFCNDMQWAVDARAYRFKWGLHGGVRLNHVNADGRVCRPEDLLELQYALPTTRNPQFDEEIGTILSRDS